MSKVHFACYVKLSFSLDTKVWGLEPNSMMDALCNYMQTYENMTITKSDVTCKKCLKMLEGSSWRIRT